MLINREMKTNEMKFSFLTGNDYKKGGWNTLYRR